MLTQLPGAEQNYAQYGANLDQIQIDQHNKELAAQRMADAIRAQGGDPSFLQGLMGGGLGGWGSLTANTLMSPIDATLGVFDPNRYG